MTLSKNIWNLADVKALANTVKAIIMQELLTMEYSSAGNSFRKQFAVPLETILTACDEYLSLYGDSEQQSPDASSTRTFIVS